VVRLLLLIRGPFWAVAREGCYESPFKKGPLTCRMPLRNQWVKSQDMNISSIDFSIARKMSRVGAIRRHIWWCGGDEKRR